MLPELALSVQQPWAWLLLHGALRVLPDGRKVGYKDCENRLWPLPREMWGERVYVHAGKSLDVDVPPWVWEDVKEDKAQVTEEAQAQRGGLVGEITFVREDNSYESDWAFGPHIWLVTDPVAYDKIIPCKGKLRFFNPGLPQVEGQDD